MKLAVLSVLLVTAVFGYAFYQTYIAAPVHVLVINEVFDVTHPKNSKMELTVVYTYGQGKYAFYGYHPFKVGNSYHVKYVAKPDPNRYLTLVYMTEVYQPG